MHDDSHLGIDKCIQQAKGSVYWPNISEDIKSIVNKCEKCLGNCIHNQKEPFVPIGIPIVAWKTVATDLFIFNDKTYILVVDLFSHFPVLRQLSGESTKLVLNALKGIFSNFGIPETIISDNGPCYKSQEFNIFCSRFDIKHVTSSAYNHQANAITERSIQTVKHLMNKNPNDTWLALLILKSMPINGINRSPTELLCNRRFRTNLPIMKYASDLSDQTKLRGDPTKYQTTSKALVPLNICSRILYDKSPDSTKRPEWSRGIVKDIKGPGCKYTIETHTGKNVTRARHDIRPDGSYVTQSGRISKPPDHLIVKM